MAESPSEPVSETKEGPAPRPRTGAWPKPLTTALGLILLTASGLLWWLTKVDPEQVWRQAEADLQAGRINAARLGRDCLLRLRSPTPLDRMLFAQVAIAEEDPDRALQDLAEVPPEHYMAAQARLLAGQIELRRKRLSKAEPAFLEALRLDSRLIRAHAELIFIYGLQLRRPELNREFRAVWDLVGLSYENLLHWCTLRNNSWEPGLVVEQLVEYVASDPDDRWSRLALAENLRRMGLSREAETYLSVLAADDHEANLIRVAIALDRDEMDRAARMLAQAGPDDPDFARLRGRKMLAEGRASEAERFFRLAYVHDPDARDTVFGLAIACDALRRPKEAAHFRNLGREMDRLTTLISRADDPNASRNLALHLEFAACCAALGRDIEAVTWLKLAVALDPLDPRAQQAIFHLESKMKK